MIVRPRPLRQGLDGVQGVIEVPPRGPVPPDPGELVGTREPADIGAQLRTRADLVLIDLPPLLQPADGMALGARADALVVVAGRNVVRRPLRDLRRVLNARPATKLGLVPTDPDDDEAYGCGHRRYDSPTTTEGRAARAAVP